MTAPCRRTLRGAAVQPLLFLALVLLLQAGLRGAEAAPAPSRLRVATYNLENYTSTGRMTGDGYKLDYPKPEEAKRALHEVILSLRADLLVLQELGGAGHLEELRRDLEALGCRYPHAAVLEAADRERKLGALSLHPFLRQVAHAKVEFPYLSGTGVSKRGLLELVLQTAAGELTVWGVHLKSRFATGTQDPDSGILRGAEATALRDLVLARHKDTANELFLIVGDFNDTKKSRPLRAFQARGKTPLAVLLEAGDQRGERWTHYYRQTDAYDRVDHVLASAALLQRLLPSGVGAAYPVRIADGPATARASDHRPLVVELDLSPVSAKQIN